MSTATSGRAREHRVRKRLTETGWVPIMRSAASKGVADLLLAHPNHGAALVQVGTGNKRLTCTLKDCDHAGRGAEQCARDRFCVAAELCSALPLVALCAPGIRPRFYIATRDVPSRWDEYLP